MTVAQALQTMEDEIVALIREGITDPLNRRAVGTWVEHQKDHFQGKTPQVIVIRGSIGEVGYTGIGKTTKDYEVYFNIQVKVNKGAGGSIDSTTYTSTELLNALTGKIIAVIETWGSYTSLSVIKELQRVGGAHYTWEPETETHYNTLQVKAYATQEDLA